METLNTNTGERRMPKTIAGRIVYTLDEVAERLGVSERSVREYLRTGRLRGQKYGRSWHITQENLQTFLDGERKDVKREG